MYWIRAYNTPEGGRTFNLETDDIERALEQSLEHVKRTTDRDKYLSALENLINGLGWHIEYKNE
jgi:hypothetical protein